MARRLRVLVCRGPDCGDKRGSSRIHAAIERALAARPPGAVDVTLGWQSCFGHCRRGVNVLVKELAPGEDAFFAAFLNLAGAGCALYHGVTVEDAPRIVEEHVEQGTILADLLKRNPLV